MDVDQEHLSSKTSIKKIQIIDSDFDPVTIHRNNHRQITVSYYIHHMNNGYYGNRDRYYCDDNIYFGIGDNDDYVGSDGDANYGAYGFKKCVTFDPQQERNIYTQLMSKSNIYELIHDDAIQDNKKYIDL